MPAPDLGPRLIDTSIWIRADRKGHNTLKDRLSELLIAGSVWICWPIRAELLIGVKTLAGQMAGFSIERLVYFISLLGQDVEITVRKATRGRRL